MPHLPYRQGYSMAVGPTLKLEDDSEQSPGQPGLSLRTMSRRRFLAQTLAIASAPLSSLAQGIASRNVKAQPRGRPSGLPFHARFVDIAKEAGLAQPVIYGE